MNILCRFHTWAYLAMVQVLDSIFRGMEFKNCILSLNKFFLLFRNGCSIMSISLLSLFVGHDGSDTMDLNMRSLGMK